MLRKYLICQLLIICYTLPSQAAIFKCEVDGKVTFSGQRCEGNTVEINVRTSQPSNKGEVDKFDPATNHEATKKFIADGERRRAIKSLKQENSLLVKEIVSYERAMDAEMERLSRKKRRAANNLGGALWEQSISQEMNAVAGKYNGNIQSANAKINRNEQEILRLEGYGSRF